MKVSYLLSGFNLLLLVLFIGETKINADEVYIVYMGKTHIDGEQRNDHAQLLDNLKKSKKADFVLHTYTKSFLGFAARLSDEEAESIARRDGVVSVFRDEVSQLHTTRSWDFLMSQTPNSIINGSTIPPSASDWPPTSGADTIIGFLDSGIWVDHPSFNEMSMGPIPKRWRGKCMHDKNSSYPPFKCNKKVIGARYYDTREYRITTASDYNGHGTMSTSIAAGKPVRGASYKGLDMGTARGGSPSSRIAMYNICGADFDCRYSAILKGFDDAISDGVDLLSVSVGHNHTDFLTDPQAIGAFHAVEKGILVLSAAGNRGPSPGTVINFAPWMLTVGSTTIDRVFDTVILLGGNKKIKSTGRNMDFSGLSISPIYQLFDGRKCIPGSLHGAKVKGKIILCEHINDTLLNDMIDGLLNQGAIGIILIDDVIRKYLIDFGTIPFAAVTEADGVQIRSYIKSTRNPLTTILPTVTTLGQKPAPVVQNSSSRGPAPSIKNLIKPDVVAPGVDILASWPLNADDEPLLFGIWYGTSIATAHVSGLAATVKSQHPTWSPSIIRSAIMTTAIHTNNLHDWITTYNGLRASPYAIGAGEISLLGPLYPGLVYETNKADYIQFLCNMSFNSSTIKSISLTVPSNFNCPSNSSPDLISDMNYPSIAISGLKAYRRRTVTRTVTNVGDVYSAYTATLEVPAGMQVLVMPKVLQFTKTVTKLSFEVTFIRTTSSQEPLFGSITWFNGKNKVRSPFAVSNA